MIIRVLYVLAAIATVVICYYAIIWVLNLLGLTVPDQLLRAIMVLIGILAVIGAISGKFDNWWTPKV
jgi:hypothetical protein